MNADNSWDKKFREEKTSWGFEPCDSANIASDLFLKEGVQEILIPGIGYGRNANVFTKNGMHVTGIEISEYAIQLAKDSNHSETIIHHGSVTNMPFDEKVFDGIFCYALIHLLNKFERKNFLRNCYNQLKRGGIMIFTVVSKKYSLYGQGQLLSKDRFRLNTGLCVFFYDHESVQNEFREFGLYEIREIDEPVKHMPEEPPIKCLLIICKKD